MIKRFMLVTTFIATSISALAATTATAVNSTTTKLDTAPVAPKSPYELTWSTSLGAERAEDSLSNQKTQITLGLKLSFDMKINSWLAMNLSPKAVIQSGYVQAVDVVDPKGNRIDIANASIDMKPSVYFSSSVGALDQSKYHDDLFMSSRAFPSVRIRVNNNVVCSNKFFGFAEAAMPTAASLSNNSNDMNQTPSLVMGGIGMELGTEKDTVNFKVQANSYQYDGLPTSLATASVLLGNSAGANTSGTDYKFKYQYQGVEAFSSIKLIATKSIELALSGAYLTNSQAPSDLNSGWVGRAEAHWNLSSKIQLIPSYEYFRIAKDATISSYNDSSYNTNRIGYMGGIQMKYNKTIKFGFSAGQRAAIISNPSQPEENMYKLTVETEDAKL